MDRGAAYKAAKGNLEQNGFGEKDEEVHFTGVRYLRGALQSYCFYRSGMVGVGVSLLHSFCFC